jgi:Domain of unknown function (DUF4129)
VKRALHRWAPLLVVGALLAAVWFAAAFSSPQINNLPVPPLRVERTESTPPASEQPSTPEDTASASDTATAVETPNERTGLITIAVVVLLLAAGGVGGWVIFRRRVASASSDPLVMSRKVVTRSARRPETVVAAVDAGLSDLSDADADPRRAVIACWVRLEGAAASAGTPRHIGDSPTDLVTRLLHEHRVGPAALDGLATIYREARYAAHTIDEGTREAAIAALRQVRSELSAAPPIAGQRRRPIPPGAGRQGSGQPGTGRQGSGQPGAGQPGVGQQGTGRHGGGRIGAGTGGGVG